MSEEKTRLIEGYQPFEKGYQPQSESISPSEPKPQGGYQPTTSGGDNPANQPTPPKEE